ncbi:HAD-IA family hydrolase [Corynebacterium sp. ES2715-CONJ3]|uniref:HAD-IA family hydrolase n=1 Tax=Corynebacterium sp. ES2715-CONJ3 TaxID=2974028 RepID=UPI0021691A1D|nr:HAD-IA family hydrolase [Corynebacterium sp. ES2715-CONJ3]MCS4492390.1 HAD-IA family hydrolase [Corynebacterium sp. ES2715-CONJ3]
MALLIFDVDGTLIDSAPGIIHSVRRALNDLGVPDPDEQWFQDLLGPQINVSFARIGLGDEAVGRFRGYYLDSGIQHASVYPGIIDVLEAALNKGHVLVTATNKPQATAEKFLQIHGLADYFAAIIGSTPERDSKEKVIAQALAKSRPEETTLMIGDRDHDILGAQLNGIPAAAATWGYGSAHEWEQARYKLTRPADLKGLL